MQAKRPNDIDVHVGSQIRNRRKVLGFSQSALALRVGVTFQQMQKYEKGTNRVGASRLMAIADVLGIEVASFFAGSPTSDAAKPGEIDPEHEALRHFMISKDGLALNHAFFKIESASTRQRIVQLAKSLAEASTRD